VWPITDYDGRRIPFPDQSFDVVFSSNVLEHIPHVESFQAEIQRILRPGGIAVHLVPSASWRVWTSLAHYGYLVKRLVSTIVRPQAADSLSAEVGERVHRRGVVGLIGRVLLSARHGEVGGPLSELYYFSRFRWSPLFRRTGWTLRHHGSDRLFYTGYSLLGDRLSMDARGVLSAVLGSACHVYVLQRGAATPPDRQANSAAN
jgi:SAM-dependent methyltransferase